MAQPNSLEVQIQTALDSLCANPQAATWSDDEWTLRVLAAVGQVARNRGYAWRSSQAGGEFLWDGAMQERDAACNLVGVSLALESEWMGRASIKEDFEKLLASGTEHRVMVCSAEALPGIQRQFGRLQKMIAAYRSRPGDRYLLAGWYGKKHTAGKFIYAVEPRAPNPIHA
jgi:hypothetical protein